MHNLINAFRPHQARETIIHMLQTQIQERRDAAHDIRKYVMRWGG
jgi:mediator of RNA polymerase II transcription subunit 7